MTNFNRPPDVVAAIQRTIEAEERLKNDLVRVCCWIEERHSIQPVKIELQRHHGCADNAVAHVVPLARDQATRRTIRGEAETVLRALGWVVKPEGRDIRSIYGRTQGRSQHDRLRYYVEIENIFRSSQVAGPNDL
ncbi:hypothetical protein [uncultured Sulfitobacter sp.]|uniref:hypothetical protein n=1 Tax=uncultured Sulfitobacter sp. TaxID=191468 RepID=UPI0030DB692D|tara:strand:- start:109 stop:513 length:405 start_codon:yes stop_codon:yes gene_type:complete